MQHIVNSLKSRWLASSPGSVGANPNLSVRLQMKLQQTVDHGGWSCLTAVYLQRIKVKPMKRLRPPSLHNFDQTGINGRSLEFRAHHSEPPATGALVHHSVLCTVHSPAQCTSHRYNATQQPPIYTTIPPVRWWFMVCMQVHSIIIQ